MQNLTYEAVTDPIRILDALGGAPTNYEEDLGFAQRLYQITFTEQDYDNACKILEEH